MSAKRKCVAFVCVSLRSGGAEKVVSMFANDLSKDFDVKIITLREVAPFYPLDDSIEVISFGSKLKPKLWVLYFPVLLLYLIKSFRRARPDCILTFGETISSFVLLAQLFRPCATLVFHRANPDVSLRGLRSIINPWLFRLADCLVFQTAAAEKALKNRYPFARTEILSNPVPVPDKTSKLQKRAKQIICTGFIGGKKNQGGLVRSFAACRNRSGWTVQFLGDGPDRPVLEKTIENLGLQSSVQIHGYTKDVLPKLDGAQIFAFPSLTEGFPNALAEGLAAGCAVISYNCPVGPAELIEDGVNGLLIPCDDEEEFSRKLDILMTDERLRLNLSTHSRRMIRKYEPEEAFKNLRMLIDSCISSKS